MGVIPLQASHSGRTSDHCRLCAAAAERDQATTTTSRKLVEVIPLGLAACLGLFLAAIDGGVVGAVGAGVAAGVATASLYLRARRRSFRHEAEDAHASTTIEGTKVKYLFRSWIYPRHHCLRILIVWILANRDVSPAGKCVQ